MMTSVSWVDVALILIILWSVATGLRAGLARVVVGFVATIAAFLVGFWFYRLIAVKLSPWLRDSTVANFVGFFLLFVGVLLLGSLVATALSRLFEWVGLSWFNRLLGGAAGFFRGVLLIAVMVDVLVAFAPSPTPADAGAFRRGSIREPHCELAGGPCAARAERLLRSADGKPQTTASG